MGVYTVDGDNGTDLFGHQAGKTFVDGHAQFADALAAKADGCRQHKICAVGFQQIGGTNVGLKSLGDQGDDVHQGLGGLAFFRREVGDFLESEDVSDVASASGYCLGGRGLGGRSLGERVRVLNLSVILFQLQALWVHF